MSSSAELSEIEVSFTAYYTGRVSPGPQARKRTAAEPATRDTVINNDDDAAATYRFVSKAFKQLKDEYKSDRRLTFKETNQSGLPTQAYVFEHLTDPNLPEYLNYAWSTIFSVKTVGAGVALAFIKGSRDLLIEIVKKRGITVQMGRTKINANSAHQVETLIDRIEKMHQREKRGKERPKAESALADDKPADKTDLVVASDRPRVSKRNPSTRISTRKSSSPQRKPRGKKPGARSARSGDDSSPESDVK